MGNEKFGKGVKFERIRRITGYLVGTLDKWCDAKKAEEKDRVKHSIGASGKWEFDCACEPICSECGKYAMIVSRYCPNCGKRMNYEGDVYG